jgi:hypothetical protein
MVKGMDWLRWKGITRKYLKLLEILEGRSQGEET